jgi:hypothetical protein
MFINQLKHVQLNIREHKLRGDVNWQGVLKGIKPGVHAGTNFVYYCVFD